LATGITQVSGTQYRLTNPGLIKPSNPIFSAGQTVSIKYNFTLPAVLTSNSAYVPSTFLGPPFQSPDTTGPPVNAQVDYTGFNYTGNDAINQLSFYNVTSNSAVIPYSTAIDQISTAATLVVASFVQNGTVYASTFLTSGNAKDVFQF
jgi:uncharacterized protein YccT (UPF0319 family)